MAKKTALVPTEVEVEDFEPADRPVTTCAACSVLHAECRRLTRSNETLLGLLTGNYTDMVEDRKTMFGMQRDLFRERTENFVHLQGLLDQKQDRKIKLERERKSDEMMYDAFKEVKALFPALFNAVTGQPILQPKEGALLASFVATLEEGELAGILRALKPAKRVAFEALLAQVPDEPDGKINPPPSEEPAPANGANGAHKEGSEDGAH